VAVHGALATRTMIRRSLYDVARVYPLLYKRMLFLSLFYTLRSEFHELTKLSDPAMAQSRYLAEVSKTRVILRARCLNLLPFSREFDWPDRAEPGWPVFQLCERSGDQVLSTIVPRLSDDSDASEACHIVHFSSFATTNPKNERLYHLMTLSATREASSLPRRHSEPVRGFQAGVEPPEEVGDMTDDSA